MDRVEEYERRAADVEALAGKAPPGTERDAMLNIAKQWRALARDVLARERRGA